ncbi:MAG: hypothetical protein LBV63_04340 [Candidatus Methanoplasma sp.]|jgi:hypothetical protein|nr:hypothetical protein [Candidatus Methanoplasma sp.]
MEERNIDKYAYLCVAVVLIILSASLFQPDAEGSVAEDDGMLGIAYDVRTSPKGYMFSFEDNKGETIRCFSYDEPMNDTIYIIKGNASDDGGMFFVKDMQRSGR